MYLDPIPGRCMELFFAQVTRSGPVFSLATVADNEALPQVRIDHRSFNGNGPAQIGDILLIGPLEYRPEGPRARSAWPVRSANPTRGFLSQKPVRSHGVISSVKGPDWGWITPSDGGAGIFVHASQLRAGTPLRIGVRVTYQEAQTHRGLAAIDVRRA